MKRVYAIQENGQVTLPAEWREKYGLKKGDMVSFTETAEGLLITPKKLLALNLFAELEEALHEKGITLEQLLDAGQDIRQEIYDEKYKTPSDRSS